MLLVTFALIALVVGCAGYAYIYNVSWQSAAAFVGENAWYLISSVFKYYGQLLGVPFSWLTAYLPKFSLQTAPVNKCHSYLNYDELFATLDEYKKQSEICKPYHVTFDPYDNYVQILA